MPNPQELLDLKQQIKASIRRNSDHGFVPYGRCMRVCNEIQTVMAIAERYTQAVDYQQAFDIYIIALLETVKLTSHADDSSGSCGEIIYGSLSEIDQLCKRVSGLSDNKYFFDKLIKTAKNKAFEDWTEWAYDLLKAAVYLVTEEKQAQKIYDLFPLLDDDQDNSKDADPMLITLEITRRLNGNEAADRYLMDNLDLPEFRKIAVETAIEHQDYALAEKLCQAVFAKESGGYWRRPSEWAYFLERIYEATINNTALTAIVRRILFHGNTDYFRKLKALYEQQGVWEKEETPLWRELSAKIGIQYYTYLLSQEGELGLLLEAVQGNKSYIADYGQQLAVQYPDAAYKIYEEYILAEAAAANDRGKYKRICHLLKSLAGACGKTPTVALIDHLSALYPRRPAMLDELESLHKKVAKQ